MDQNNPNNFDPNYNGAPNNNANPGYNGAPNNTANNYNGASNNTVNPNYDQSTMNAVDPNYNATNPNNSTNQTYHADPNYNANQQSAVDPNYAGNQNYGVDPNYNVNQSYNANVNTLPAWQTKWNWGAFIMGPAFAVGLRANLAWLSIVPVLNLFWIFWSGAKGEMWALENGDYRDEAEFRKMMDSWNRAGIVTSIFAVIAIVVSTILFIVISASAARYLYLY